jgi:hypothetical protein
MLIVMLSTRDAASLALQRTTKSAKPDKYEVSEG